MPKKNKVKLHKTAQMIKRLEVSFALLAGITVEDFKNIGTLSKEKLDQLVIKLEANMRCPVTAEEKLAMEILRKSGIFKKLMGAKMSVPKVIL